MTTNRCKDFDAALVPHLAALRRRSRALTGNAVDAADLFQDTLERALRGAGRFRSETNLFAWLLTIMQRRAIDLSRQGRWRLRSVSTDVYDVPNPPPYAPVPWENIGTGQLRRAMTRLPDHMRSTLAMRVIDRLPCRDIAQRLAISVFTVHTRLLRARRKLRDLLQEPESLRRSLKIGGNPTGRRAAAARQAAPAGIAVTGIRVAKRSARA
jgi:RNA polymerase sigma-70 factor (ECF subfamily)